MRVVQQKQGPTAKAPRREPRAEPAERSAERPPSGLLPPAALLDFQRTAGNAAVVRALQRQARPAQDKDASVSGPVEPSTVPKVLGTSGKPLAGGVRTEMETRLGADFSDVRVHTGADAQRSALELGARAYTSGNHVVIGDGGGDRHTLAHELTHVIQQRQGPVAGTDHGNGLRVSDPSDRFERAAEDNARRVLARPLPEPADASHEAHDPAAHHSASAQRAAANPVQRYVVVNPGDANYPNVGTVDAHGQPGPAAPDFFPSQEERPRIVQDPHTGPRQADSFVAADGSLNVVYNGQAPLRLAEKMDLAVEHITDGRQAKTFFATSDRIDKANAQLRGKVRLDRGQGVLTLQRTKRFLNIKIMDQNLTLWQVEPVVQNPGRGQAPQRGLAVRLSQRCNEIATEVTAKPAPQFTGEDLYFEAIFKVIDELAGSAAVNDLRTRYGAARTAAISDQSKLPGLAAVISEMIQRVMAFRDNPTQLPQLQATYEKFKVNEFTTKAGVGDLFMIKGLRADSTSGGLDFHFASVVAKSGRDHVTMENFARHEEEGTLSSGDPQWYFEMYGPVEKMQTFHEQWGWANRFTAQSADNRLVLTILMQG
ncbi:eCIS core domain-containing protein [Streptomyces sp. HUAS TT7]|uniref:eCIS core domain-containing protein n=1 Tax=Streptomyces sp. HUAS TT7 TaxID=3447507 RepID=UPI003F65BAE4